MGKVQNDDLKELVKEIPTLVLSDKAPSTVKKYSGAVNRWIKWARSNGFQALPAAPSAFAIYIVYLMQTTSSIASVNAAVYGLKWAHKKLYLECLTESIIVMQLVESAARILSKARKPKEALTNKQVRSLILRLSIGSLAKIQLACLIALGFSGFMRWDDLSKIYVDEIIITASHAMMFVEKRKNDQFREGSWIPVARSNTLSCPVSILEKFMRLGGHKGHVKLFRKVCRVKKGMKLGVQGWSYNSALEMFKKELTDMGLNAKVYGLHSLRSGGASTAASVGIPDRLIARQGGWRSLKTVCRYIKETLEHKLIPSKACGI